jgi:hypothetical protein
MLSPEVFSFPTKVHLVPLLGSDMGIVFVDWG